MHNKPRGTSTQAGRTRRKARFTVSSLKRDDVLLSKDIKMERVPCPEWAPKGMKPKDAYLNAAALTAKEFGDLQKTMIEQRGKRQVVNIEGLQIKLVAIGARDDDGNRIFSDNDVEELSKKSSAPVLRVAKKIQELSGLGDDDLKELTNELSENPLGGSPSDSPKNSE